jgi:hypothetical protein
MMKLTVSVRNFTNALETGREDCRTRSTDLLIAEG